MKKIWVLAYMDSIHLDRRIIIGMVMLGIVLLTQVFPYTEILLWGYLLLLLYAICAETIILIGQNGICAYTFRKKCFMPWDEVAYYGITTELQHSKRQIQYLYFAKQPLVRAPTERLPYISNCMLYLTYTKKVSTSLASIGKRHIVENLPHLVHYHISKDMQRKILGSMVLLLGVIISVIFYFAVSEPMLLLWMVFPCAYIAFFVIIYLRSY